MRQQRPNTNTPKNKHQNTNLTGRIPLGRFLNIKAEGYTSNQMTFKSCCITDCPEQPLARGLCKKHYRSFMGQGLIARVRPVGRQICIKCSKPAVGRQRCMTHYRALIRFEYRFCWKLYQMLLDVPSHLCHVKGCTELRLYTKYCMKHYMRWYQYGDTSVVLSNKTHGMTKTPTYNSWSNMIQQCTNPKATCYSKYGAKGITVCARWRGSFDNFLADMGERPTGTTIDRVNPTGNYEPGNCRWGTALQQAHNRQRLSAANKSGFRGVYWHSGKWAATINPGKQLYLGRFVKKEEAARAYNKAALTHFGAEAVLNPV